jgi:ribosome-associated protein
LKAVDVKVLDVEEISSFTDVMIVATGASTRQVKALADRVTEKCKEAGVRPLGVEGERESEWILVDLGDVVVHIMNPETRDFYQLEKLWSLGNRSHSRSTAKR